MSTFIANDNKTNTQDTNIPHSSTYNSNDIMAKLNELTKNKDDDKDKDSSKSDTIKFWSDDPNVLFQKDQIFEFYPVTTMTYSQKLNAISRTIILITIITFILTQSLRIVVIAAITLGSIFLLYHYQEKNNKKQDNKKPTEKSDLTKEGFDDAGIAYLKQNSIPLPDNAFSKPTVNNPFSNVLLPDYDYNPNKKPAPPAYSSDVNNDILVNAKKLVVDSNPDQPDIADKLFKDLGDNLDFEQSLRPFNSNPSTTIPNDQAAFADFCYGSMVSCKEGNLFACARNLARHIN